MSVRVTPVTNCLFYHWQKLTLAAWEPSQFSFHPSCPRLTSVAAGSPWGILISAGLFELHSSPWTTASVGLEESGFLCPLCPVTLSPILASPSDTLVAACSNCLSKQRALGRFEMFWGFLKELCSDLQRQKDHTRSFWVKIQISGWRDWIPSP